MTNMKKYFIVSDVHSFYDELLEALKEKQFDINNENHILCVCGDLFDRGPKSKELLEFVKSLCDRFIYVIGNHEYLLQYCVQEISSGMSISKNHFSNGTVRTIAQLCDEHEVEFMWVRRSNSFNQKVYETMKPVLDWIFEKSMPYYKIGDYILVHGWGPIVINNSGKEELLPEDEWDKHLLWEFDTWHNGMEKWKNGLVIPGKTIICGHWHCSWGWSHIDQRRKEFPDKSRRNWKKSFEPYVKEGIMAIDACTAYTEFVNCIILEV